MSASVAFAPFNSALLESDWQHRAAVDCLKWQLGQPVSWVPPPLPDWPLPLSPPRPYYYYDDDYYYYNFGGAPWRAEYSRGFRDGLAASDRSAAPAAGQAKPTAQQSPKSGSGGDKNASAAAGYPGDLMEFPSASYRRPVGPVPLSTCTSYDDLTAGWPYGCKPFFYRRADPPTVRYN